MLFQKNPKGALAFVQAIGNTLKQGKINYYPIIINHDAESHKVRHFFAVAGKSLYTKGMQIFMFFLKKDKCSILNGYMIYNNCIMIDFTPFHCVLLHFFNKKRG